MRGNSRKHYLTLALAAFMMIPCIAIGATPKDVLILGHVSDIATLDPAKAYDSRSYKMLYGVYETLVGYKRATDAAGNTTYTGALEPRLAESWESSPDGSKWTFKLKKGIKFHDGTPFNAEAVKFSLDRAMLMTGGPEWYLTSCLEPEKSIEVIDESTVRFNLTKPVATFLPVLTQPVAMIVSPTAVKTHGGIEPGKVNEWMANNAVGTGPFRLKERIPSEQVVLVANPDYWGQNPQVKTIIFKVIKESSNLIMLLKSGEIDMILRGLTYKDYSDLEKSSGIKLYKKEDWGELRFAPCSFKNPPMDNTRVRQALNFAVDKKTIIDKVCYGYAAVLDGPIPSGMWSYDKSLNPYSYNPTKAKQLLKEAGFPEGFSVEMGYPEADAERREVAMIVQSNLKDAGIDVKLTGYSWPTFLDKYWAGSLPFMMAKWSPLPDPDFLLTSQFHTKNQGKGGNVCFYSNPKVDDLLDKARVEVDRQKRRELYREVQKIILEDAPWVFLYSPMRLIAMRDNVMGYGMPDTEVYYWETVFKK
jgi:peptide/nickel transport system substrate-binding protein